MIVPGKGEQRLSMMQPGLYVFDERRAVNHKIGIAIRYELLDASHANLLTQFGE